MEVTRLTYRARVGKRAIGPNGSRGQPIIEPSSLAPDPPLPRWPLALIVLGAIAVRLAVMATGLTRLDDPDRYLTLANSLAEGHGFVWKGRPTAYRPPLYPILLTPLVASLGRQALPWGIGALHLALGVGTVLLTAWTARRWGLTRVRALIAAAIVAFDPVLVVQARSVMTETPASFLVALILAAVTLRGSWGSVLGGLAFGLACLCRPSFLPAALLTATVALFVAPGSWRVRVLRSGLLVLATVATLAPWAWRNARVLGEPVWTTTHGGHTLALANNPVYYADVLDGPAGTVWSGPNQAEWFAAVDRQIRGMSEPDADRSLRASAVRTARERPWQFLRSSLARIGRFWGLAPSGAVYPFALRVATAAWTTPLWLALLLGLPNRSNWRWPGISAPLILMALTLVHLVYWTDLRMRAPLVPAIALIAAGCEMGIIGRCLEKLTGKQGRHRGRFKN